MRMRRWTLHHPIRLENYHFLSPLASSPSHPHYSIKSNASLQPRVFGTVSEHRSQNLIKNESTSFTVWPHSASPVATSRPPR